MSFTIAGTGKSHPKLVVTNDMMSEIVETNDEWISTRTGIKSRYISTDETLFDLTLAASQQAMKNANIAADKLDFIICSTMQGDYKTPSLSCQIQHAIGAKCPAVDINAACTGFIYALDFAAALMDSGRAENILIASSEMMSKHIDWSDRATCVLFGDGSGAAVVTKGDGLLAMRLAAKGDEKLLVIGGSHGNNPFDKKQPVHEYLTMEGGEVFKFAVSSMCNDVKYVLEQANLTLDDIRMVIPHQANMRIIQAAAKRLGLHDSQIMSGIDRYGNTSSASIPILLSELIENGTLKKGDIIILTAFGGGLTSGACIIKL